MFEGFFVNFNYPVCVLEPGQPVEKRVEIAFIYLVAYFELAVNGLRIIYVRRITFEKFFQAIEFLVFKSGFSIGFCGFLYGFGFQRHVIREKFGGQKILCGTFIVFLIKFFQP